MLIRMRDSRLQVWLENEWDTFDGLEKRRVLRSPCDWPVKVQASEETWTGTALDVSSRGLRLALPLDASLKRGQEIELHSLRPVRSRLANQARAVVRWYRKEKACLLVGVSVAQLKEVEQSWLYALLASVFSKGGEQKRSSLRVHCSLEVNFRSSHGVFSGRLLDLSIGGGLLETEASLTVGGQVEITLGPCAPLPALLLIARLQRVAKSGEFFLYGLRFQVGHSNRQALLGYVRYSYTLGRRR